MSEIKSKARTVFAWGGFSDGRLSYLDVDTGFGGFNMGKAHVAMPAVFNKRELARVHFQDVRKVEIREVKKP